MFLPDLCLLLSVLSLQLIASNLLSIIAVAAAFLPPMGMLLTANARLERSRRNPPTL